MLRLQKLDKIKQYTALICNQIRYKQAHNVISEEIENHIIDQRDSFINEGLDEVTATDKAIKEMGDPIIVGSELDRTHRPRPEWSIIALTISALLAGLSVNLFIEISSGEPSFRRFAVGVILGIVCMMVAYFIDFTIISKYPRILFISLAVIMLVFWAFSLQMNGARRWINTPIFGYVSWKYMMLLFPMLYSGIIYSMRNKGYLGIFLCGIFYFIPIIIALLIPSLLVVFIHTVICLILLSISICKGWFNVNRLHGMLLVFIPVALFVIMELPSVVSSNRFQILLDPHIDPLGAGFRTIIIRDILNDANFIGQGSLSNDMSSWLLGFSTHNIIVLVYLVHQIGWISAIGISIILSVFMARGIYLCFKQKSFLGQLISLSVLLTLSMQILIYMSSNLGFPLFHSDTLPFISRGNSGMMVNLTLVGIILSVFKTGNLVRDSRSTQTRDYKFLEFTDGKIIIDLNPK